MHALSKQYVSKLMVLLNLNRATMAFDRFLFVVVSLVSKVEIQNVIVGTIFSKKVVTISE